MRKIILSFIIACILIFNLYPKEIKIIRDGTPLKNGPGNYFETITIFRSGIIVKYSGEAKDNKLWIQIEFNDIKGYVSKTSLRDIKPDDKFADFNDDVQSKQSISLSSYNSAIKGFVIKYTNKKGYSADNIDDLLAITNFSTIDIFTYRNEAKLSYFPKEGELLGYKGTYINQNTEAIGLAASMDVLKKGIVWDKKMTKRLNVIANILNEQTIDYDVVYRAWVIKDIEPTVFSGPGGYIFVSDTLLKLINNTGELTAIISHEIGHIVMRHGIRDLAIEQSRYTINDSFNELDQDTTDNGSAIISKDLDNTIEQAVQSLKIVRDIKEEYEADDIAMQLLGRYKIDRSCLTSSLKKIGTTLTAANSDYKKQIQNRLDRISKL